MTPPQNVGNTTKMLYRPLFFQVRVFSDMINNIFAPLFEVSVNPDANLALHAFLKTVVGFDSVDDESKRETIQLHLDRYLPAPEEWDLQDNPPYTYWSYYVAQNITSLNRLRQSKVKPQTVSVYTCCAFFAWQPWLDLRYNSTDRRTRAPGSYVLHLVSKAKLSLFSCVAVPDLPATCCSFDISRNTSGIEHVRIQTSLRRGR